MKIIRVIIFLVVLWLSSGIIFRGFFPVYPKLRPDVVASGMVPIEDVDRLTRKASGERYDSARYATIVVGCVVFLFFTSRSTNRQKGTAESAPRP